MRRARRKGRAAGARYRRLPPHAASRSAPGAERKNADVPTGAVLLLAASPLFLTAEALSGQAGGVPIEGGEAIARQVARAPDGWVRFTYEPRPGVCGNGRYISVDRDGGRIWMRGAGGDCDCACEEGPARIEMRVRDGAVRDLDLDVGGTWRSRTGEVTDLGEVEPGAAADYLLDLAETGRSEAAEDALFPATIARGVEAWPRLLGIARADGPRRDVRKQAVFWLGQEASERATEGLESIIESDEEIEVREHAVFALSQRPDEEAVTALLRVARTNPEPRIRKKAIFWLGQHDDPRVLALFEELLTGGS